MRLGLNGDEFRETRDLLLAHLDGDRAWRFDKDSYEVNRNKKKKHREAGEVTMKIRIDDTIYEGTGAEILEQLRLAAFDPTEFPDTESYLWQLRSNFIRMTDRDCVLPEHGLEEQARVLFGELAKIGALEVLENG